MFAAAPPLELLVALEHHARPDELDELARVEEQGRQVGPLVPLPPTPRCAHHAQPDELEDVADLAQPAPSERSVPIVLAVSGWQQDRLAPQRPRPKSRWGDYGRVMKRMDFQATSLPVREAASFADRRAAALRSNPDLKHIACGTHS